MALPWNTLPQALPPQVEIQQNLARATGSEQSQVAEIDPLGNRTTLIYSACSTPAATSAAEQTRISSSSFRNFRSTSLAAYCSQ